MVVLVDGTTGEAIRAGSVWVATGDAIEVALAGGLRGLRRPEGETVAVGGLEGAGLREAAANRRLAKARPKEGVWMPSEMWLKKLSRKRTYRVAVLAGGLEGHGGSTSEQWRWMPEGPAQVDDR